MTKLKRSDRAFDLESDAATQAATVEHCTPPCIIRPRVSRGIRQDKRMYRRSLSDRQDLKTTDQGCRWQSGPYGQAAPRPKAAGTCEPHLAIWRVSKDPLHFRHESFGLKISLGKGCAE